MSRLWRAWCWVLGVKPEAEEVTAGVVGQTIVPERLSWPVPDPVWKQREERRLGRVAALVDKGCTPWSAASRVFCGAGGTRRGSRAGLSRSVAGVRRDSVPR